MQKQVVGLLVVLLVSGFSVGTLGGEWEADHGAEQRVEAGKTAFQSGKYAEAAAHFEEALKTLERTVGSEHLVYLSTRGNLTSALRELGHLEEAQELAQSTYQDHQRILGPEAPQTLKAKSQIASIFNVRGDLEKAQTIFDEVLLTQTRVLGAEHPSTLATMNNLATVLLGRGYYDRAKALYEDTLQIKSRLLGPEAISTLLTRSNLVLVLQAQGEAEQARALSEEVMDTQTRILGPEHPMTLESKSRLVGILVAQGDLEKARTLSEEVLESQTRILGDEHRLTLYTKTNLAVTLGLQQDYVKAQQLNEEVLEVQTRVFGPAHPMTLGVKLNIAVQLSNQAEYEAAAPLLEEVLEAATSIVGPRHPLILNTQHSLATNRLNLKNWKEAIPLFEDILAVEEEFLATEEASTMDSFRETGERQASTYWRLGIAYVGLGDLTKAAGFFHEALEMSEWQTMRFNASEDRRSAFRVKYDNNYQIAIKTFLDLDRPAEAFDILQRYRAQSFQRQLFQRIASDARVPPGLVTERQRLTWQYDQLGHRFHGSASPLERRSLIPRLQELQQDLQVNRNAILEATGQKNSAVALHLDAIQQTIAPGTLVLTYLTSSFQSTLLFALDSRGDLTFYELPVPLEELEAQIDRFIGQSTDNPGNDGASAAEQRRARLLFDQLLAPAAERIAQSERLVIIPDGPLHHLPFSALVAPEGDPENERGKYLVEWKPIHTAASASLYAHLRQAPRHPPNGNEPLRIAAIGDPVFPSNPDNTNGDAQRWIEAAEERSLFDGLIRLPHSGREVDSIGALYGSGEVEILRRGDATEGRVKQLLPRAEILHFATHGVVDPERPLDSFVALTIPETLAEGDDNGILQAWELDEWKLSADLVVLSACDTANGENRGGEGVISLSRAFQAAGARSVVASLWQVADASTAELMVRFHRHLRSGLPKNEALRQAQLELIRDSAIHVPSLEERGRPVPGAEGPVTEARNFSHPYHWAAFQLIGDWQ